MAATVVVAYGDSHAEAAFRGLEKTSSGICLLDRHHNSKTMFSVGRDQSVIDFDLSELAQLQSQQEKKVVLCFVFGEIDCRCHIHLQRQLHHRDEDTIINSLVAAYLKTIKQITQSLASNCRIVIFGVVPPAPSEDQLPTFTFTGRESIRSITPFFGHNSTRLRYTRKVNAQLVAGCLLHGFTYFYPYANYADKQTGMMRSDCADATKIHVKDNAEIQQQFLSQILATEALTASFDV